MKKILSIFISLSIALMMIPSMAFADNSEESYEGKTIIIYTGNLRGDIDNYAKLAQAKKDIKDKGADAVYLVDAGNYLQGKTYANSDRGKSIYELMDAAGYDVAAMGAYEFVFGDATTGQIYHNNLTKYHTQKMLYEGQNELIYGKGMEGKPKATLKAVAAPSFKVISSNITGISSVSMSPSVQTVGEKEQLYAFENTAMLNKGSLKVGFTALTDKCVPDMLQDDYFKELEYSEPAAPTKSSDLKIGLTNNGQNVANADLTIKISTGGDKTIGAYAINNKTKKAEPLDFDLKNYKEDGVISSKIDEVKKNAEDVIATSDISFIGKNSKHRSQETNMGDLVTDALLWYANNKFEGFKKDVPVVAIQNGGNVRESIHTGDITQTDLFSAYPFSPMGIGILYVTGEQLLESLEEANQTNPCNAFPQVSGLTYSLDLSETYDQSTTKGDKHDGTYGKNFYYADSYNRVSITSVNGDKKGFDLKKTYAVVADNAVIKRGLDTYGTFKTLCAAAIERDDDSYLDNGKGILVRDVVAKYLKEGLQEKVSASYADPQGRITFEASNYKKAKAAMEKAKATGTPAEYMAAAKKMVKEADITCNEEKIAEAAKAVKDAKKFKATKKDLRKIKARIADAVYNGKARKPKVKIKGLKEKKDFKVYYSNNKNIGTASALIKGIGKYMGTINKTFKIKPAQVKITKTKSGNKTVSVKFKKVKGGVKYQLAYKIKKGGKWKYNVTTKNTIKINNVKSNKKYVIKVRAMKKVRSKNYCGAWSKQKTVNIK